jgi:hypothetical protein
VTRVPNTTAAGTAVTASGQPKDRSTAHASTTTSMAADDDLAGLRARLLSADPATDGDGAGQAVAGIQAGEARVG